MEISKDDESDPQLTLLLKLVRSTQTAVDTLPYECPELLERLRQIPDQTQSKPSERSVDGIRELPYQRLGQCELLERIAGGGMGEVFKARHLKLDKLVAIKLLYQDRMADRQLLDRFEQEMQAVGRLNHEHIVRPLDADEQDGVPYLVLEYVEGKTLAAVLEVYSAAGEPFPIALACEFIRQAAVGLDHAHRHGIIHRDIKPANLMLAETGIIKILDLGLARLNELASDDTQRRKKDLTREGQVMGTPDYMAPEQLENSRQVDARTDIYALGATLFKLLVGRAPHADAGDGSLTAKLLAIATKPTPSLRQFRSDVPLELDALVQRMLSKLPNNRPQTAIEVAEALRPIASKIERVTLPVSSAGRVGVSNLCKGPWSSTFKITAAHVAAGLCVVLSLMNRNRTDTKTNEIVARPPNANLAPSALTTADPDRIAAEWVLSLKSLSRPSVRVRLRDSGLEKDVLPDERLPEEPFSVIVIGAPSVTTLTDDEVARFIVPLRSIVELNIGMCSNVTDAVAPAIKQLSTLGYLRLGGTKVSSHTLVEIATALPSLTSISVTADQFSDELAEYIRSTPRITSVSLYGGTDAQLRQLLSATQLTYLGFYGRAENTTWRELPERLPNLDFLSIQTSNVTDADLAEIARCPKLRILSVQVTSISDTGLLALQSCQTLTLLSAHQTKVTEAGVRRLHELLPRCHIQWDGGVMEPIATTARPEMPQPSARPPSPLDPPSMKPATESAKHGFIPLFNGTDLTGWKTATGKTGHWKVVDGAITCAGFNDHLYTIRNDFGDFHLRAEVKINETGNSGIYFRAGLPLAIVGDYEAQISNRSNQPKTGSLYNLVNLDRVLVQPDTWFVLEIIAQDNRLRVLVNGEETANYVENREGRRLEGYIALQHHDADSVVHFRKIEIAPMRR